MNGTREMWHGSIQYSRRVCSPLSTPQDGIARVRTRVTAFGAFFYAGIAAQFIENDLNTIRRTDPTGSIAKRSLWFSRGKTRGFLRRAPESPRVAFAYGST